MTERLSLPLHSKPFVPLFAREIQMLRDDFRNRIVPHRQNREAYVLSANSVRSYIVDKSLALDWHNIGVEHFIRTVGTLLLTEQEAWIEIVANSREDSDKLFHIFPVAGVRRNSSGMLIQELSQSVTLPDWYPGDKTLRDSVELDPSRMVYVPLPEEYPRHLIKHILTELAEIVSPLPDWTLERMVGQLPNAPRLDYAEAFRMEKHRVLQITSPIGWAARENYGPQPWEITYYYYLLRELRFLYFVSTMRRSTETALRRVLDIAGELCGFTASVTSYGIYTPEEVCSFIGKFKSGDLTFTAVKEVIYQEFSDSSEVQQRSI